MAFGRLVLQVCNTKILPDAIAVELPLRNGQWSTVEVIPPFLNTIRWPTTGPSFNDFELKLQTFSKRFNGYD